MSNTVGADELAADVTLDYLTRFDLRFQGVLRWSQSSELWDKVLSDKEGGWYVYAIGEQPPAEVATGASVETFVHEIDALLRRDHDEDYCGIVYTDDFDVPSFIKIFDPNNLGSACGSSGIKTLPGWTLSKLAPVDLPSAMPAPNNRRRWWQQLFKK